MDKECLVCTTYFPCPDCFAKRPRGKIVAVKISYDYGATWKIRALCETCIAEIEPPTMLKREAEAGTRTCDFCLTVNRKFKTKKRKSKAVI